MIEKDLSERVLIRLDFHRNIFLQFVIRYRQNIIANDKEGKDHEKIKYCIGIVGISRTT